MSTEDLRDNLPPVPGTRVVEVRDDRTTSRLAWVRIPADAPDPTPDADTDEQLTHIRALSKRLMANHGPDAAHDAERRDPTTSQQEERP